MNVSMCAASAAAISVLFVLSGCAQVETVNTAATTTVNKTEDLRKSHMEYMFSRPMSETMARIGVEEDRKFGLQLGCQSQYQVNAISAAIVKPIEFQEGKQHPIKGAWISRYRLDRCGDSKVYNALFIANSNGEAPTSRTYYPGSPYAGAQLVQDAMMMAVVTGKINSGLKECETIYVFDMRVTEPPHNVVEKGSTLQGVWNELWTFSICGKMVDVPMTFIPDPRGGTTYKAE